MSDMVISQTVKQGISQTPNALSELNPPAALTSLRNWLVWRMVHRDGQPKPSKIPYYADGAPRGMQDTPEDRARLVTFDEARTAASRGDYTGVGFALLPGAGIVALDFDNCVAAGEIAPHVEALCEGTYSEISPSGNGVRAFFLGNLLSRKDTTAVNGPFPVEVFGHNGFVTVTGNVTDTCRVFGWDATVSPLTPQVLDMYRSRGWALDSTPASAEDLRSLAPTLGMSRAEVAAALAKLPGDLDYDSWVKVGMAVHHETHGDGFDLWDAWSRQSPKYTTPEYGRARWASFGRYMGAPTTMASVQRLCRDSAGDQEPERYDVFLSRKLADMLNDRYVFEHGGREWLQYDQGAFTSCTHGEVQEEAKRLGVVVLRESSRDETLDTDAAAKVGKLVTRAMSAAGINAAIGLARSDPRIAVAPGDFDTDPDVLNTANCALRLSTLDVVQHSPGLRLSRQCSVPWEPGAKCPTWDRFLQDISLNDPDWIDYVQRACGYTLLGATPEELLFFLLGRGANGKSVLANVLRCVLGTYATTVPANFLTVSKRDGETATPALATLPGARLALANEVEAGSRLSAQTVKIACSTEAISARHIYGRPFTFVPTHTLWVRGNHKPIITDNDDGIWRRIVLIPFERNFAPHERDAGLEAKLMNEAPGILRWMVHGFTEYRHRGLRPTGRIAAASASYRKESDLLGQWLDEAAELGPQHREVQSAAYANYQAWCTGQGVRYVAKKSFTRGLEERGIGQGQVGSGGRERTYMGLRLIQGWVAAAQDAQDFA